MYLKVEIDIQSYENIIKNYNDEKTDEMECLEKLDIREGGFCIKIPDRRDKNLDPNLKIKQLRWFNKVLVPYMKFMSFNQEELILLYKSIEKEIGSENISWIKL